MLWWITEKLSSEPDNLGVDNGRLAPCPKSPNCVSSQADADDDVHYIDPIPFEGSGSAAFTKLQEIVASMPRTEIQSVEELYLHATQRTKGMGFIDDFEIVVDEAAQLIHLRSAARLGYDDIQVNRKRVEHIRKRFAAG